MAIDLEEVGRRLDFLLSSQQEREGREDQKRRSREHKKLVKYGLRSSEAKSWLREEHSFPKAIVKPLSDDSYHKDSSDEDVTEPRGVRFIKRPITFTRRAW